MKLRFLAAAGPPGLRAKLDNVRTRAGLVEVLAGRDLSIWVETGTPVIRVTGAEGAIVGLLFERNGNRPVRSLEVADLEHRIPRSFWGAYVLVHSEGHRHLVMRDPSGALPIYYGHAGGLDLYASDSGMLKLAWPARFQPDLDTARHWLTFPFLRTASTGAIGVRELLPGMSRSAAPDGERLDLRWSPASFAGQRDASLRLEDAAGLLRTELLRTISCLARNDEPVALHLSGGLDSSIIAAALAHAGIGFRAATFASGSPEGDERQFASAVARHFGVALLELNETDLPSMATARACPLRPPPNPVLAPLHVALGTATDARLVLDGAGGDNVFGFISSASPALDAWSALGPYAAVKSLSDLAALHGCTIWTAARSAFRRARMEKMLPWKRDDSFLMPNAALETAALHPWLSASPDMAAGAADHVRLIAGIHHFLPDPRDQAPAILHPLLAEPILELCLKIPSWLWTAGGRDRAVARAAFAGLLPEMILERRGKGSLEGLFARGYLRLRSSLEDSLGHGLLVSAGILDEQKVVSYLREEGPLRDLRHVRILEIAAIERWLRAFNA